MGEGSFWVLDTYLLDLLCPLKNRCAEANSSKCNGGCETGDTAADDADAHLTTGEVWNA